VICDLGEDSQKVQPLRNGARAIQRCAGDRTRGDEDKGEGGGEGGEVEVTKNWKPRARLGLMREIGETVGRA
jgi:hypothetical protein